MPWRSVSPIMEQAHERLVKTDKWIRPLKIIDVAAFLILLAVLALLIALFSQANIQSDSIDYYAILQKLTGNDHPPIVQNLHFMEQRSPGYSLAAALPYYLISEPLSLVAGTQQVAVPANGPPGPAGPGIMAIPPGPLPSSAIFFKDFPVNGSLFQWKIILALLVTSYVALFAGILFTAGALRLEGRNVTGVSLVMLVIVSSSVFMLNILQTPAYATLFAFGVSAAFCYFFVRAGRTKGQADEAICGLLLGLLVLTRLETALILLVVLAGLLLYRDYRFCRNATAGALVALPVLLAYNMAFFGNPLHAGILAGDINLITVDAGYIANSLVNPASGILFWSTLTALGVLGLAAGKERYHRIFLACSLALVGLYLVRVPIMYLHIGGGPMEIGGIPITPPAGMSDALALIRSDMNRYLTILVPFAVLGLRSLLGTLATSIHGRARPEA